MLAKLFLHGNMPIIVIDLELIFTLKMTYVKPKP